MMSVEGNGLPALFPLSGFEGSLTDYLDALYGRYCAFLHEPDLRILGKPVFGFGGDTADGKDWRFWHCVTAHRWRDWWNHDRSRELSLERCALLTRTLGLLELAGTGSPHVLCWRENGWRGPHVLVTDGQYSMLVVLFERRSTLILKTQYPICRRGERAELRARAWHAWSGGAVGLAA